MNLVDVQTGEITSKTDDKAIALVDEKFRFTPTGLIVMGDPTFAECQETYQILTNFGRRVHFWIGDLLNYVESRWGETYAQLMDETGLAYQTLANDKWVTSKVDVSRRRENLRFSHHAEVAGLEPPEQEKWLRKAEREELTTSQLRRQIKATRTLSNPGHDHGPEMIEMTIEIALKVPVNGKDAVRQSIERWALRVAEHGATCESLDIREDES